MFFPNFSTFTLFTPLVLRQRRIEDIVKNGKHNVCSKLSNLYSRDSNFVSTSKTQKKKKIDIYIFLSIMFKKKTNFSFIEGVHRTYVTVANQSTVHRMNSSRKEICWLHLQITNHSERTLLLGDSRSNCISQTFLLDRKP